jgi:hypothetical protein
MTILSLVSTIVWLDILSAMTPPNTPSWICRRASFLLRVIPFVLALVGSTFASDPFRITSFSELGAIGWTNAFAHGVNWLEWAPSVEGPWSAAESYYTTRSAGEGQLEPRPGNAYYRLISAEVNPTPQGYTNLINSYGIIETIAGNGLIGLDTTNGWQDSFEGGYATNATLSRPHFAMADDAGNTYIVDKNSHSVLKVTTDGRIHTVIGTHEPGDNGDGPHYGTNQALSFPNGLWVRGDGTVYVLDTGNGEVRRLDTNGVVTGLFVISPSAETNGVPGGRGLWVNEDETMAIFCTGKALQQWKGGQVTIISDKFNDLGNIIVTSTGDVIATDRGANRVYQVSMNGGFVGTRTVIAGDGKGGAKRVRDGTAALSASLSGVRGVWPVPTGGLLLATHAGSQLVYMDASGTLYVLVDGATSPNHTGDGAWFHSPGLKLAEIRSVTMDRLGNILICENDFGYIRRIRFNRALP